MVFFLPPIRLYRDSIYQNTTSIQPVPVESRKLALITLATGGGLGPTVFLRQDVIGVVMSDTGITWELYFTVCYLGNVALDLVLLGLVFMLYRIEANARVRAAGSLDKISYTLDEANRKETLG
jgi:hypothetical protein